MRSRPRHQPSFLVLLSLHQLTISTQTAAISLIYHRRSLGLHQPLRLSPWQHQGSPLRSPSVWALRVSFRWEPLQRRHPLLPCRKRHLHRLFILQRRQSEALNHEESVLHCYALSHDQASIPHLKRKSKTTVKMGLIGSRAPIQLLFLSDTLLLLTNRKAPSHSHLPSILQVWDLSIEELHHQSRHRRSSSSR